MKVVEVAQELSMAAQEGVWARPDLRAVYEEHAGFIHALLARLLGPSADAEDVMQEVFVVALKKYPSFRGPDVRSWLCNIAIRLAIAARRRVWFSRVLALTKSPEAVDWRTPEHLYELDEATRRVYAALEHLSEKKRTVFVLFELHGMSGPEVAAAVGCPENTARSRLLHARREFRRALDRLEERDRAARKRALSSGQAKRGAS